MSALDYFDHVIMYIINEINLLYFIITVVIYTFHETPNDFVDNWKEWKSKLKIIVSVLIFFLHWFLYLPFWKLELDSIQLQNPP